MVHHAHGIIWQRDAKQFKAESCMGNMHQQYLTEHPTRYLTAALIYFWIRPEPFDKDSESRPKLHPH